MIIAWRCLTTGDVIGPADHDHRLACGQDPDGFEPIDGAAVGDAGAALVPGVDPQDYTHRQLSAAAKALGLDAVGSKADIASRISAADPAKAAEALAAARA